MKKRIRKGLLAFCLCMVFLGADLTSYCYGENYTDVPEERELYAKAAVLMDGDSGRVLYEKNGKLPLANASTTKILTCILALEMGTMEEIVTASKKAAAAPKVHLGMAEGNQFYMEDLLYALMLESYNDCAVAIAEHLAASVEAFAQIMNEKAKEIGCKDTYFITPNGLDARDAYGFHHTTAEDLGKIMQYCILTSEKSDRFREITARRSHSFCEITSGRTYTVTNHNSFLDMMPGAFSGKTGFTGAAGYCYVGALEQNGNTYIVALLACGWPNNRNYKWSDCKKLFEYGIESFQKMDLNRIPIDEGKLENILVLRGQGTKIGEDTYTRLHIGTVQGEDTVLLQSSDEITLVYEIIGKCTAPVEAGTYAGKIKLMLEEEVLREYWLYITEKIEEIDYQWCFKMIFEVFLNGVRK